MIHQHLAVLEVPQIVPHLAVAHLVAEHLAVVGLAAANCRRLDGSLVVQLCSTGSKTSHCWYSQHSKASSVWLAQRHPKATFELQEAAAAALFAFQTF
jgi:hypothetical protein